jgi:hypothetical protein
VGSRKGREGEAEALLVMSKSKLEDLTRIIDEAMDELGWLAEEYGSLSLSGSFSAPLEKVILLLEQWYKGMEEKGVPLELLTKVQTSLDNMKGEAGPSQTGQSKSGERIKFWAEAGHKP